MGTHTAVSSPLSIAVMAQRVCQRPAKVCRKCFTFGQRQRPRNITKTQKIGACLALERL